MSRYPKTVKRLASMTADKNQRFVSIYIPTQGRTVEKIKKKIKSILLTSSKLNGYKDSVHFLVRIVENKVEILKLDSSLAIFAVLDKRGRGSLEITTLPTKVKESVVFANVFDLAQFAAASRINKTLVIKINQEKASIWEVLNGSGTKKILENENKELKKWNLENDYLDKYSPTREGSAVYSTGKDKVDKLIKEVSKNFLDKFASKVANIKAHSNIVVFYSNTFNESIKDFAHNIRKNQKPDILLTINKQLNNDQKMLEVAETNIKNEHKKQQRQNLKTAKNSTKPFVTGWKEVAEAANQNRIDKLFIKPNPTKKGYVIPEAIYSTYPIKNSRKTDNLSAWIVKDAISKNSDIVLGERFKIPQATLRY